VTTHAVFAFDRDIAEAYLAEIYEGVSVDHLLARMGWSPRIAQPVGLIRPFREEEVGALRRLDPDGFWTGGDISARMHGASASNLGKGVP